MVDILAPGRQRQLLDTYVHAHPCGVTPPQITIFAKKQVLPQWTLWST